LPENLLASELLGVEKGTVKDSAGNRVDLNERTNELPLDTLK